jgi:glycerol-3-phosphate dehydrogenase (NAD(P)+)
MERFETVGVIGAGAFGTALAEAAARAGRTVVLWGRDAGKMADIAATGRNPKLPGTRLSAAVRPTASLAEAAAASLLILTTPTQVLAEVSAALAPFIVRPKPLVAAAKGIERGSGRFVTEIVRDVVPGAIPAILSGPGFAPDIARGAPTALTLACSDLALAARLARSIGSPTFRLYHSTDIRGVEIGGSAKNVIAIAAGVAAGKGFGESAVAALIARGFAELTRFGLALGAQAETLAGLSGLGDLILTGTSSRSRNRRLGEALAHGASLAEAIATAGLAEGVWTAGVLVETARAKGVEMPVAAAVAELVAERTTVDAAIEVLLSRPMRSE